MAVFLINLAGCGWVFPANTDFTSWYQFRAPNIEITQGVITQQGKTNFSEGGSDHSEGTPIYVSYYAFSFNPQYAMMIDSLPGSPRIDNQGHFLPGSIVQAIACLILPVITILSHSVVLYFKILN